MFFFGGGRGVSPFAPSSASTNPHRVIKEFSFLWLDYTLGRDGLAGNRWKLQPVRDLFEPFFCSVVAIFFGGIMNNTCMPNAGDIEVVM